MHSRMGVDHSVYTTEVDLPRLGTWAGLLLGFGTRNTTTWVMNYLMLTPKAVLLVFGEKNALLGALHLDRCKVEQFDYTKGHELTGMGLLKLSTIDGMPVCTFSSASALYVLLSSVALQKTWIAALQTATVESMRALDRAFSKTPVSLAPSAAAAAASASMLSLKMEDANAVRQSRVQSLLWLNLFLERYFADMMQSQTYYYRTMKMLSEKLLLIRKPAWIGSINLKELNIGNAAINISSVSFRSGSQPRELIGQADIVYKGGLRISYGAILNIGKSLRVPVEVLVHLESVAGRLTIFAPALLHEKWSAYFREMPDVSVTVKVIVGGQDKRLEVTSLKNLHKFAQKTFLKQVELALLFPSRLRFYLPIRGRKAALRNQRFNAELGGYQYPVPLVLQTTLLARAANRIDERKDFVPTWSEKGTLKADLREFLVRRLFEVVLNHGYLKLLPQLLHNDVRMTGGCPQMEYVGLEQGGNCKNTSFVCFVFHFCFSLPCIVYAHFRQLWGAFEDFECVIMGISFDVNGQSVCRWRISGVNVKGLWDSPPSNKPVAIYGVTQVNYEPKQFRLIRLRTFYRMPLLVPFMREKEKDIHSSVGGDEKYEEPSRKSSIFTKAKDVPK
jgi:hypothetical protein